MKTALFASAAVLAACLAPLDSHALDPVPDTEKKLEQQIAQMQQQLLEMKEQLRQLKSQNEALAEQQRMQAAQVQQVTTAAPPAQGGISKDLSLWGYGEVYYLHPTHSPARTQADLSRAVFGIGYRFSDRTVFNSEFEVEHAIASSVDSGEFEVEQFYIDHQINSWAAIKAGLFLMPFGLLNEHHEPTQFYGVQRNFVEYLIIPTTWREGGVGVHGNTQLGLTWDVGVTTGFNLGGWNFNPENPLYRDAYDLKDGGPLQATHQELQHANARDLSQYVALSYNGVPGFSVGASAFTGKAALPTYPVPLPSERIWLYDAHARWTPGAADISAVFARGSISNTEALNIVNAGVSNPLPSSFQGYYLQGAYRVWERGMYRLSPFVRWETYDLARSFSGITPGFSSIPTGLAADGLPWPRTRDTVWTFGANFYVTPHVVFKADYQTFRDNKDFTRFDLGLGLAY